MKTCSYLSGIALLAVGMAGLGCRGSSQHFKACNDAVEGHYQLASAQIEYPAVNSCSTACFNEAIDSLAPRTLSSGEPAEFRDVGLAEVVEIAFANTTVLSDLGGAVVRSPGATRTIHDPSITETDPILGIESALSAFDAQWTTSLFAENNDRALNNEFIVGGARVLQENNGVYHTQLSKRSVTGTELSARKIVEFNGNNAPANLYPTPGPRRSRERSAIPSCRGVAWSLIALPVPPGPLVSIPAWSLRGSIPTSSWPTSKSPSATT